MSIPFAEVVKDESKVRDELKALGKWDDKEWTGKPKNVEDWVKDNRPDWGPWYREMIVERLYGCSNTVPDGKNL